MVPLPQGIKKKRLPNQSYQIIPSDNNATDRFRMYDLNKRDFYKKQLTTRGKCPSEKAVSNPKKGLKLKLPCLALKQPALNFVYDLCCIF